MSQRVAAGGEAKLEASRSESESEQGDCSRRPRTRSRASYPGAGRGGGKTPWRAAPTGVEKPGDDPGVGVKGQSSPEISRSPRNSFGASPGRSPAAVEHRIPRGPRSLPKGTELRTPPGQDPGSQDAGAKFRAREGNSQDRPPRPPSHRRVAKDVRLPRQPGRWPRSSNPSKECVTAHWPSWRAPTIHGLSDAPKRRDGA